MQGIGHLGDSQELCQFRPQHAGSAVYSFRSAENRVCAYSFALLNNADGPRKDLCSPPDIRSRKGRVRDQISRLRSQADAVPQYAGRGFRPHAQCDDPRVRCLLLNP